jgi:hypothetical protein
MTQIFPSRVFNSVVIQPGSIDSDSVMSLPISQIKLSERGGDRFISTGALSHRNQNFKKKNKVKV